MRSQRYTRQPSHSPSDLQQPTVAAQRPPVRAAWASRARRVAVLAGCATLALGTLAGCETKSFLDPGELGRYEHQDLTLKILNQVDPAVEEPNEEYVTATEPTAADLIASTNDYVISKNDLLTLEISDLNGPGVNTVKTARVTESGNVSLPFIGNVHAEGLTESGLEQAIKDEYKRQNILQNAQVSVTVTEARGRAFSILGAVAAPGQYAIFEPDFRVLDALVVARDTTSPLLEDLYIIRKTGPEAGTTQPATGAAPTAPGTAPGGGGPVDLSPHPRATTGPVSLAPHAYRQTAYRPQVGDATRASVASSRVLHLDADASPGPANLAPGSKPPVAADVPPPEGAPKGRYVTVDGKPVYIGPETGPSAAPAPSDVVAPAATAPSGNGGGATIVGNNPGTTDTATVAPPPAAPAAAAGSDTASTNGGSATGGKGFEFNDLPTPQNTRIIHIPLNLLRNGQLQYNVVIKPKDVIMVQPLPTGNYYMGGHIARPGAYILTQQRVTLKQAVIAAGMLDQLAIPERTDIIRRIGEPSRSGPGGGSAIGHEVFVRIDLAKIFSGQQSDIYLKPNDQVIVGTNALAPFLAAIRGGFRITYGFGFLYDRNFAAAENNKIGK